MYTKYLDYYHTKEPPPKVRTNGGGRSLNDLLRYCRGGTGCAYSAELSLA